LRCNRDDATLIRHMADLSTEDVLKLARLSRLKLSDDEVDTFKKEINEILSYVDMLKEADTKDLKPTYQVTGLENKMRKDEVKDYGVTQDELLENLPDKDGVYIKTKRVL